VLMISTPGRAEPLDFVQVNYSLGEREAERRILPLARDRGIAVLVNRPFSEGGLFQRVRGQALPAWTAAFGCQSWAQFFLKWILAHPAVTCVIPATSRLEHLVDNMTAGVGSLPDDATRERMGAIVASGINSSIASGHPRPVAFVNGFQNATLVAAIIAVAGAVVAATTLQHARHREPAREAFPEAA